MRGHRPNYRRDSRRRVIQEGRCTINGCDRPSGVTYYGYPLCNACYDYYASDNLPKNTLKKILKIKEIKAPQEVAAPKEPESDTVDPSEIFPELLDIPDKPIYANTMEQMIKDGAVRCPRCKTCEVKPINGEEPTDTTVEVRYECLVCKATFSKPL